MAIPTITSVTPATGHSAGGTLVEVIGTGFKLPDAPPLSGPVPVPPPPMRAFFGAVEAVRVDVITSTRLQILTPGYTLPKGADSVLVDLELRNVGSFGETIGAERVVLTDGYRFSRPALDATQEGTISRVTRELVLATQRATIEEVVIVQNTDWSDDPSDVLRKAAIAKLPAVFLGGPRLRKNVVYTTQDPVDVNVSSTLVRRYRPPRYVDLLFTIGALGDNFLLVLGLVEGLVEMVERAPWVVIPKDPAAPAGEQVRFDIQWEGGEPEADSASNVSNVYVATGTLAVLGVPILGRPSFENDMAVQEMPAFPEGGSPLEVTLTSEPE